MKFTKNSLNLSSFTFLVAVIISFGYYQSFEIKNYGIMAAVMAITAVVIFFGILIISKKDKEENNFPVEYIRLAMASTIIIEFFIYFGAVVYLEDEVAIASEELIEILATIIGAVFTFYFSAEAAKRMSQNISNRKINEAKYHALGKIAEVELAKKEPKTDQILELFGKISQDDKK